MDTFDKKTIPWPLETPEMLVYAREEWGQPLHGDQALFELFSLEIFQAGLSWQTVLKKRPAFEEAFAQFDIAEVAAMPETRMQVLMQDQRIIRNRLKIQATVHNAQVIQALQAKGTTFDAYLWQFVGGQPMEPQPKTRTDVPTQTYLSELMAKALKQQGFKFIGPTTLYSFLEAAGLVNDRLKLK